MNNERDIGTIKELFKTSITKVNMNMGKLTLGSFSKVSPEKQQELDKLKALQNKIDDQEKQEKAEAKKAAEDAEKKTANQDNTKNGDKPISRKQVLSVMNWLMKTYPKLFSNTFDKPLMCGVHKDIFLEHSDKLFCSKAVMRKGLRMYVNHPRYLNTILTSENRYNLNGEIAGTVTPDDKQSATERLDQQKKRRKK